MDEALMQAASELVAELLADARKAWAKEVEIISAESRAIIAELRAQNAEIVAALKDHAGAHAAQVRDAIAAIKPGKDADPADTERMVEAAVSKAVAALPVAEPGKSVTLADVAPVIAEHVAKAVAEIPIPTAQAPLAVDMEQVGVLVIEAVEKAAKGIPDQIRRDVDVLVKAKVDEAVFALPVPEPGKSVTMEEVEPVLAERVTAAVEKAVALLPVPKDGDSVTVDQLAPVISVEVEKAVAALPKPQDGTSVTIEQATPVLAELVERAVAALPAAEPGKSVTITDVEPVLADLVSKAVAALPAVEPGKSVTVEDVTPVIEGFVKKWMPTPEAGKSVTVEDVTPLLTDLVEKTLAEWPKPKDGDSVTVGQVRPVLADLVTEAMKAIPAPKDGVGLAGALIDRDGALVVTLTNGEAKTLGPVVGRDADRDALVAFIKDEFAKIPVPKDGLDGLGFDDMEVEHDGERMITLRWVRGEQVKEAKIEMPVVIDRGVFKDGRSYGRGDGVTWGGSYWIAQDDTGDKPGDGSKAWRLAVKKGRDGKEVVKLPHAEPKPFKLSSADPDKAS